VHWCITANVVRLNAHTFHTNEDETDSCSVNNYTTALSYVFMRVEQSP